MGYSSLEWVIGLLEVEVYCLKIYGKYGESS